MYAERSSLYFSLSFPAFPPPADHSRMISLGCISIPYKLQFSMVNTENSARY